MMAFPNDVETMTANVKMLIQDSNLRDRIRENGLATAKKYSWNGSTEQLIRFLESV